MGNNRPGDIVFADFIARFVNEEQFEKILSFRFKSPAKAQPKKIVRRMPKGKGFFVFGEKSNSHCFFLLLV